MKNMSVMADLKSQGWVTIVGFENYLTDGVDVRSFAKGNSGSTLRWVAATNAEQVVLHNGRKARGVTRSALAKAYADGGVLPASRTKIQKTAKSGVSKYTYTADGVVCTLPHIVEVTGLSYWTVHGRFKTHGAFEFGGVQYLRR